MLSEDNPLPEWILERLYAQALGDIATGCVLWQGFRIRSGYGQMNFSRRLGALLVHRLAYALDHRIPLSDMKFLVVMHKCNTPACIRPEHLRLGTQRENIADMDTQGRKARGTQLRTAKLTEDQVRTIRAEYANGVSGVALARGYNVSVSLISQIVLRKIWAHI